MIGKVTKLDINTDSRARGRYARIAVFVNFERPLISKILINGAVENVAPSEQATVATTTTEEGKYGPWMLVEWKSRRGNLEGAKKGNNLKKEENSGLRFHSLADLEISSLEQESTKNPKSSLKSKGKGILIDSDVNVNTGRKVVGNSLNKANLNWLIIKPQKGQARSSKSNIEMIAHSTGVNKKGLENPIALSTANPPASSNNGKTHGSRSSGLQLELQSSKNCLETDPNELSIMQVPMTSSEAMSRPLIVEVKEGVLDVGNHSAVVFNNKRSLETGDSAGSNLVKVGCKSQIAKKSVSKCGWKLNKTLKGSEPRISGSKADLIIAKIGLDKAHYVEAVGFSKDSFPRSILIAFMYGSLDKVRNVFNRPFRFLASWLPHHNFSDFVKENWSFYGNMTNAIACFTDRLTNWNNCVYGHISQRKRRLVHKLSNVQRTVDLLESNSLRHKEFIIREELKSILYHEEIFWKQKSKSPGSDGFQAGFFQKQWEIIREDICDWVKNVFDGEIIDPEFNNTLIVLIPKVQNPENFSQFKPISLCSVLYKLVMKIIANRFKKFLHTMRVKKSLQWMTIKIDLEKAYDMVRWDFVEASLITAGIPSHLTKVIMNAIKLSFIQVLWNGEPTQKFKQVRGVNISSRNEIKDILGFHEVNNLGHYLEVSLFHIRVTKSILDFLVEKVRNRLSSWDAKSLSFAGRVTLAQSVLLAIPSYFMQSSLVPKGVCDTIEGLIRQFIWRATESKRKIALVKWENLCQPKDNGGLGFRRLSDQNSAFMMKLGYNLIFKIGTLWVQVLRGKYGMKESMPDSIIRSNCSYMWRAVARAWPLLRSFMIWSIGDGKSVRCWKGCWVPDKGPLKNYVSGYGFFDPKTTVSEMVLPNGVWNLALFRLWLPEDVVERIISIPPPMIQAGSDCLSWSRTTSVKSAFMF
ncbi:hypothetical protein PVK06_007428 [Gossypium arboreum]|uniref:Reverse transcriptase domain-containing protein n=1 Tax=Gossypium arboreum TaxID=29729 RepID=A0ABR0QHG7_GOSAR|nr:hypothetical protein PVK06_007428 [Gossypium arboreum]